MNDDDDMPPDLEDLPEELTAKKSVKKVGQGDLVNKLVDDYTKINEKFEEIKIDTQPKVKEDEIKKSEKPVAFAGIKKGFFSEPSEPKSKPKAKEEMVTIKANPNKQDSKVIPEVQEAMKLGESILDKKDQWLTPDLLKMLTENPNLAKLFANPEYLQAITMMQKNPKEVMEKYGKNKEFMELMTQFSSTMGDHFTNLSNKEPPSNNPTTQPIPIDDKEVEEILKDKKVKSFLEYLQKSQKVDFHAVMRSDPDLGKKIKVLIDKKLIQIQSA